MYSVVLMAAMTVTPSTPSWGWRHGCHGCYGGYACAGCYGGYGCYGCRGGWGGCYGYGCNGCYGGYGCYGSAYYGCHGCWGAPAGGEIMPGPGGRPERVPPPKEEKSKTGTSVDAPAKLIVELPADAKLYIDDHLMKTASAKRLFNTPKLEAGETYYYILKGEIDTDGKKFSEKKVA